MPLDTKYCLAAIALFQPKTKLYSTVPLSSQFPSILILIFGCFFMYWAILSRTAGTFWLIPHLWMYVRLYLSKLKCISWKIDLSCCSLIVDVWVAGFTVVVTGFSTLTSFGAVLTHFLLCMHIQPLVIKATAAMAATIAPVFLIIFSPPKIILSLKRSDPFCF